VYTHDTRVLVRLDYDYNADGSIDVRTYMRNGRPVRLEGDTDGDGRVDRWEYYRADGELLRIGASSEDDGRVDTWIRTSGDERFIEKSTARDGVIDRREVYKGNTLVRVEFDDLRLGRPTRRIVYGMGGEARVETIEEEDGHASR
jgi:hypothetical protein